MNPRTIATLDELHAVEWFRNVGVNDAETAIVLSSWQEAIESCAGDDWQDLLIEAPNQYRERLIEKSRERFRQWNDIVVEVKPFAQALVLEKIAKVVAANNLPKVFVDTVNWDILHLCMECEFADVYPPGFFASHAYWYLNGHFPCGWRGGPFPEEGRLVVY